MLPSLNEQIIKINEILPIKSKIESTADLTRSLCVEMTELYNKLREAEPLLAVIPLTSSKSSKTGVNAIESFIEDFNVSQNTYASIVECQILVKTTNNLNQTYSFGTKKKRRST